MSIVEESSERAKSLSLYLLGIITVFMVIFGLIMVFSASSVTLMESDLQPWRLFIAQFVFGTIGLASMFVLMRIPSQIYKRFSTLALILTDVFLVGVLVFGSTQGGNKNWVSILGIFTFQPSEIAKLTLTIWLGAHMAKYVQEDEIRNPRALLNKENLLGVGTTVFLILLGQDLGTALVFMLMLFIELYISGVPKRWLLIPTLLGSVVVTYFVLSSSNRRERILGNYTNCNGETQGICYQSIHGQWALATGGLTGVGPGASREKWSYLPEAHNDFIFAVIGEELGLAGTMFIIICYILLIVAMVIAMKNVTEVFERITIGGIMAWIGGQACFNIGAVLRILPVVGVPLPLISYGGTALISTLAGIGVVMSFVYTPNAGVNRKEIRKIKTVVPV
jgi:cell division protein FtsW